MKGPDLHGTIRIYQMKPPPKKDISLAPKCLFLDMVAETVPLGGRGESKFELKLQKFFRTPSDGSL